MNDGEPASPLVTSSHGESGENHYLYEHTGMTLLDYFATRAPTNQTFAFETAMPTPCPESQWVEGQPKPINAFAIAEWEHEYIRQTMIQWPWVWAEAMLAERERREAAKKNESKP